MNTIKFVRENIYQIGNLKINTTKNEYFTKSLSHIEVAKKIQHKLIANLEEQLAQARTAMGIIRTAENEITVNYQASVKDVEIVKISSVKTGKIVETMLVSLDFAVEKIQKETKWMLKSVHSEMYGEEASSVLENEDVYSVIENQYK